MARKSNLDEPFVYYIPENFIAAGTVGGGMFKVRNVVEAIVLMIALGYPIALLPVSITIRLVLLAIVCLPVGILALVGINHGPLSEYLIDVFKYRKIAHDYTYEEKVKTENNEEKRGDRHEKE